MHWLERNIFLVDGLGAVASTAATGTLLGWLHGVFGMPRPTLFVLVLAAVGFAVYSLTCWRRGAPLRPWLPVVMAANLAYCVLVAGAVVWHHAQLTWLGIAYFAGEVGIIVGVVLLERWVLTRRGQTAG